MTDNQLQALLNAFREQKHVLDEIVNLLRAQRNQRSTKV